MRPVLLALIRAVSLPTVGVLALELVIPDAPLETEPDEGCRTLSPMLDRELVILLGVDMVGALLG